MPGDVLLYALSAVIAAGLAVVTIYHGHRVWGVVSAVVYAAAAVASAIIVRPARGTAGRPGAGDAGHPRDGANAGERGGDGGGRDYRPRMAVAGAVFAASALLPLVVLVVQRVHGVPWSAQPEVDVVERMGRLLLATGTPYAAVDTLARFEDYAPYLPAMAVFGLPRAALGASTLGAALTDVRLVFLAAAAVLVALAVRVLGQRGMPIPAARPTDRWTAPSGRLPVRAVQLVAVLPATTLTVATGGDDLPVLALLVLSVACCHAGRGVPAGVAGGLALAMKLTAAPVLFVLAVALAVRSGRRAAVFAGTALAVAAALVLPAAVVSPAALVEHVVRYPAGLTGVESPAASPLPGHLLAQTGPAGRAAALVLLALAAGAILVWVLRWPPRCAAEAAERAAIGLTVAMLSMPATRFGYLVYPLVLAGTALAVRSTSSSYGSLRPGHAE